MKRYIRISPSDNVGVALDSKGLKKGDILEDYGQEIFLREDIMLGHKFALKVIHKGEKIIKYGYPIGIATEDIEKGSHVHTHNLRTGLGLNLDYEYHPSDLRVQRDKEDITVNGYARSNGDMGIRNELWIIPTVGCVNAQAQAIAERVRREFDLTGVDDVRAYTHNYGCSQLGEDHENTRAALSALAMHPNAGGVLMLGLGCENNRLSVIKDNLSCYDPDRIRFLVAQDVEDEIEEGVRLCGELINRMHSDRRSAQPISKLRIGLKCGGSDGLSGITANPLTGMFSDWLIRHGGTTVLTEVPEMFGAETILMDRSADEAVFHETVGLINDFKEYFRSYGQPIYENPSPGNKDGGISTLEEKSLGCVQKGGTMPVVDVLRYAEPIIKNGLNLLQAPGNDLVAASALALSGCQMVLFTTGRGTPFGTFVPTLKISTNSKLASRKKNWIDFNAGSIIEEESPRQTLSRLIGKVIETAGGSLTMNERSGAKELAIFKNGVTL